MLRHHNKHPLTPFSLDKENHCPNQSNSQLPKLRTLHQKTPPGSDPDFHIFKTIHIPGPSQQASITTKSRVDMEAILENFSTKGQSRLKLTQYSHKSFLALLGLAFGKQEFSVNEAIQKCEQHQISGKHQLISMMEEKEPTRQWPLPLSNLLLTDLGHLKVMKICEKVEGQQDLDQIQMQILQFLLPNAANIDILDRTVVLECFNEFKNRIEQKCGRVDELVKEYTLKVQPKIRAVSDKVGLIKMEKKIRRHEKGGNGVIGFGQLGPCLDIFRLTQEQLVLVFKYLYFIENDRVMDLADRRMTVSCSTCCQELLQKDCKAPLSKHTRSTLQFYERQNNNIINQLLNDKNYLLETIHRKNQEVQTLNNQLVLFKFQLENRDKQHRLEREREVQNVKSRYQGVISNLQEQNKSKDILIQWYKNELEAVVDQHQKEFIASNRHRVFYKVTKSNTKAIKSTAREDGCFKDQDSDFNSEHSP